MKQTMNPVYYIINQFEQVAQQIGFKIAFLLPVQF